MKIDMESMQRIALFEKQVHVDVKDFFEFKEKYYFVVSEGNVGKAVGKGGENLKNLEKLYNRKIKIVEFSPNAEQYVANILKPLKVIDVKRDGALIIVRGEDERTNGLIIGARAQNLRFWETVVQKFHSDVKEIKVV